MATPQEKIQEAQDAIAQQIQEQAGCGNPEYLLALNKIYQDLDASKQRVIDAEGASNQIFRQQSRGVV